MKPPDTSSNPSLSIFKWLEPLIAIVLAIHGSALLLSTNSTLPQWLAIATMAAMGVLGHLRRNSGVMETRIRRIALFICAWLMMAFHSGVASFFFFWLVVLTATYPLLVPLNEGKYLPLLVALGYWALVPFSTSLLPKVVLINKFIHLNIIGYLVYFLASLQAKYITKLHRTEGALRDQEQRYRLLAEHTSDLVGLHNAKGQFIYVSPSVTPILGYQDEELLGKTLEDLRQSNPNQQPTSITFEDLTKAYRVRHSNGGSIWLETNLTEIHDERGNLTLIQSTSRDVSARVASELELRRFALQDPLTLLPNRRYFLKRFGREVARSRQNPGYCFAILVVDLDSFKAVNDSWGHECGDLLLAKVAEYITDCIGKGDLAARMGGDEFTILLTQVEELRQVTDTTTCLFSRLKQPIELSQTDRIVPTASIGIVLSTVAYDEPQELIRYADLAMYRAKRDGKARYAIYDPDIDIESQNGSSTG